MRKRGKRLSFALMIPLSAVLLLLGVVISLTVYKVDYDALYRERVATVLSVVEVADEVVRHYGKMEENGELSREEAQLLASEAVSSMRYNGQDYVFGYDMDQRVTIPFQGHERGKRLDSQDANGVWVQRGLTAIAGSSERSGHDDLPLAKLQQRCGGGESGLRQELLPLGLVVRHRALYLRSEGLGDVFGA
ncbi:cache domain-containing protein [Dethiosulfovibrio salsuginis]|uniref:cache domain-containing protein n=1 Tax=Dethiosulfovibrio salsuginis TaxID=561720 RepID=UPI000A1CF1A8|nr:cache domain-containing protein [Dethiosulfovibrio salsuginis]